MEKAMACIQKVERKKGVVYRVYIKKKGVRRISKSFDSKRLAVQFVNSIESDRKTYIIFTTDWQTLYICF